MSNSFSELNEALFARIESIKQSYQPRIQALQSKATLLKQDADDKKPSDWEAVIDVDFKVEWKDRRLSIDFPSVVVKDRRVSLDLPEITKSSQSIAFDVPDVRMVRVKVGEKPEVYGWTVRWTPIWIDLPEPYMRRIDIRFDLPSVTMRRQDFVLGVPELKMSRIEWVMTLPEFTVNKVSATISDMKNQGEAIAAEGIKLGADMKGEIDREVALFQGSINSMFEGTKLKVGNVYNNALGEVHAAISSLASQGCDPIKVPTPSGDVNLRKIYEDLDANKNRAINDLNVVAPT
jgi:hypothetical protein